MATMLSRQWTDPREHWWINRSASRWKLRKGASAAQVSALEKVLGDINLPRDYKAFLRLVDGTEFFWYSSQRNILFFDFSKVSWETPGIVQHDNLLLSSIFGAAALRGIHKELAYSTTPASLAIRLLQIDNAHRIFLVDPAACRQIGQLWLPLLSQPVLSEKVKREASQYSTDHFGSVSPLLAMMFWSTWVVLEVRQQDTMDTRLYPSFTDFLDELANREKIEWTPGWMPEPGAVQNARFAADDRHRWEPLLKPYALSGK
ncbi:hypothetical protein M434DRAFT_282028 [Hypoxylon sp. CO27-5]|nr:hypothetical protein M434DRAFT_282028 [Hypoxylon sp. CO27-5]